MSKAELVACYSDILKKASCCIKGAYLKDNNSVVINTEFGDYNVNITACSNLFILREMVKALTE